MKPIRRLRNRFIKTTMAGVLGVLASLAKDPNKATITDWVLKRLALSTLRLKGVRSANNLETLGRGWQQAFPATKEVPIRLITDDTVYAEIHTHCPLKGSGDMEACHRMMAYDRHFVSQLGGEFRVLQSQVDPAVQVCQVAMRLKPQGENTAWNP